MATIKEVTEFLNSLSAHDYLTDATKEVLFDEYYITIYGTINFCKGCSNDINMAIVRLKKEVIKQKDNVELVRNMTQTKYKFKKDVRLYSSTLKLMVTKHNLTDAIAEKLIAENGKHEDLFETIEEPTPAITINFVQDEIVEPVVQETPKKGRKKKLNKTTAL